MRNKKLFRLCRRRLPTMLVIVSAVTGAAALYFTGKATVKAVRKYDELKAENVEITPKIVIKELVPYYIPAVGLGTTSLACNIVGHGMQIKRNKMLEITATNAVETLKEFKTKAQEVVGEDKVKEIEAEQAKDKPLLQVDGNYDTPIRVYDVNTGVKIQTTYKKLYEAEAMLNSELSYSGYSRSQVPLSDFYSYLGATKEHLEKLKRYYSTKYWDIDYMEVNYETNYILFSHEEVFDRDGTLMVMLRYSPDPEYDFTLEEWEKTQ